MKCELLLDAMDFFDPVLIDRAAIWREKRSAKPDRKARRRVLFSAGVAVAAAMFILTVALIRDRRAAPIPVEPSVPARPDAADVAYLPGLSLPDPDEETVEYEGLSVGESLYAALLDMNNQRFCVQVTGANDEDLVKYRNAGIFIERVSDNVYIYPTREEFTALNALASDGKPLRFSLSSDPVIGEAWKNRIVNHNYSAGTVVRVTFDPLGRFSSSSGDSFTDADRIEETLDLLLRIEEYCDQPTERSEEEVLLNSSKPWNTENGGYGGLRFSFADETDASDKPDSFLILFTKDSLFIESYENGSSTFVCYATKTDPKPLVDALKEVAETVPPVYDPTLEEAWNRYLSENGASDVALIVGSSGYAGLRTSDPEKIAVLLNALSSLKDVTDLVPVSYNKHRSNPFSGYGSFLLKNGSDVLLSFVVSRDYITFNPDKTTPDGQSAAVVCRTTTDPKPIMDAVADLLTSLADDGLSPSYYPPSYNELIRRGRLVFPTTAER